MYVPRAAESHFFSTFTGGDAERLKIPVLERRIRSMTPILSQIKCANSEIRINFPNSSKM